MTSPRIQPINTKTLRISALQEQLQMAKERGFLSLVASIKRDIEETSKE